MLKLGLCLDGQCPLETACVSACLATGWAVKHTERHDGSTLHNSFPGCGPNEGGGEGIKCREEAPNGRTDGRTKSKEIWTCFPRDYYSAWRRIFLQQFGVPFVTSPPISNRKSSTVRLVWGERTSVPKLYFIMNLMLHQTIHVLNIIINFQVPSFLKVRGRKAEGF